jgi:ribosomal protein S18 acetylase RimI-like enzyme
MDLSKFKFIMKPNKDLKNGERLAISKFALNNNFNCIPVCSIYGYKPTEQKHINKLYNEAQNLFDKNYTEKNILINEDMLNKIMLYGYNKYNKGLISTIYCIDKFNIIGFITFGVHPSGCHDLHFLLVHKDYRNQGISKKLVDECISLIFATINILLTPLDNVQTHKIRVQTEIPNYFKKYGFEYEEEFNAELTLPNHFWLSKKII